MREAITTSVRSIELREIAEPPPPGPGDALLDIASVGICGSDIGMWAGSDPYSTFPNRQGHEFSGRIAAFGDVDPGSLAVGDLVAVEPLLPDGTCIACRRGRPNCCVSLRVYGAHLPGAFADRLVVPVTNLYPVRDLSADLAAFVEPISIGLQMVTRGDLREGDRAVILGAGPIGQAVLVAASDRGARAMAVDVVPGRLQRALENGAELVVDAASDHVAARVAEWTEGEGPPVVFEASGVGSVLRQAIDIAANSGTVVVAGTSNDDVAIPSMAIVKKELNLLGSRNNTRLYAEAVDLVERYRDRCEMLITHRFPLERLQEAMAFGEANPTLVNKMIVQVGEAAMGLAS